MAHFSTCFSDLLIEREWPAFQWRGSADSAGDVFTGDAPVVDSAAIPFEPDDVVATVLFSPFIASRSAP